MAVEPEAGGLQTIYVTDMSTSPLHNTDGDIRKKILEN
jgi:hypothetical protein